MPPANCRRDAVAWRCSSGVTDRFARNGYDVADGHRVRGPSRYPFGFHGARPGRTKSWAIRFDDRHIALRHEWDGRHGKRNSRNGHLRNGRIKLNFRRRRKRWRVRSVQLGPVGRYRIRHAEPVHLRDDCRIDAGDRYHSARRNRTRQRRHQPTGARARAGTGSQCSFALRRIRHDDARDLRPGRQHWNHDECARHDEYTRNVVVIRLLKLIDPHGRHQCASDRLFSPSCWSWLAA